MFDPLYDMCSECNMSECLCKFEFYDTCYVRNMSKTKNVRKPLANSTKNDAQLPHAQISNLVFDEMNSENRSYDLAEKTTKNHHNRSETIQTSGDDKSTFGLVKRGLRNANLNICHI